MPKDPRLVIKKTLSMPLEKINFLDDVDNDDIFLNVLVVLSPPLKNLVNVFIRKLFALDIDLDKIAMIKFAQSDQADLVMVEWSILIRKNAVRVAKTNTDRKLWNIRNQHRALLYTLLISTNTHDI
ncbi:hypothetical protein G9A89_014018 [Geosiphon pyriformis]|nr:hypothetical protein G9A89_014018 [Geosiphon pyriformis]